MATIGTYITGYLPQLILGEFIFSLNTAAFQEQARETGYRWGKQERFRNAPALQYLGPGDDTINLQGVIYPGYRGGTGQIARMRDMAGRGQPLVMIDGTGNVYGRWVIEQVTEKRNTFAPLGIPKKQEFELKIRHFDGGDFNAFLDFLSSLF